MAHPTWPLFDLVVRTPMLELRLPTEDELVDLLSRIDGTIYSHLGFLPFGRDWPNGEHSESMQYHWRLRADWKPEKWNLALVPFVDGRPVGSQGMWASEFAALRRVTSGSWLLRSAQGRGVGSEMRAALLHLAFEGLGAIEACSAAHVDNAASNRVSERLGYEVTHTAAEMFGGERADAVNLRLRREVWEANRRDDIEIRGLESCLAMFGLDPSS